MDETAGGHACKPRDQDTSIRYRDSQLQARRTCAERYKNIASEGRDVLVVGAKFLPVVLLHLSSESLVAGVVGVPGHTE